MSFDLAASLRRLKPEKKTDPLRRRGDDALPFVADGATVGPPLLLDTTVYIDTLQDRLPEEVADLLRLRRIDHRRSGWQNSPLPSGAWTRRMPELQMPCGPFMKRSTPFQITVSRRRACKPSWKPGF